MASRKVLGTTVENAPIKETIKFDEKDLKKAEKIAEDFFSKHDCKSYHPFVLEKHIAEFVAETGNKKLHSEIEYVIFKKCVRQK